MGNNVLVIAYVLVGTYVLGGTNVPERAYVLIENNVRGTNVPVRTNVLVSANFPAGSNVLGATY